MWSGIWIKFYSVLYFVTEGMDAIGEVTVKVKEQGRSFVGHGASTDIIEASAKAYINAINKVIHFRENG